MFDKLGERESRTTTRGSRGSRGSRAYSSHSNIFGGNDDQSAYSSRPRTNESQITNKVGGKYSNDSEVNSLVIEHEIDDGDKRHSRPHSSKDPSTEAGRAAHVAADRQRQGGTVAQSHEILKVDHIIGSACHHSKFFVIHPTDADILVYFVGHAVVISNVKDPHDQIIMQGHDAPVGAIAVSNDGKIVASGQARSLKCKSSSPVIMWDYAQKKMIAIFEGLMDGVGCVEFSPDGRFLAGADLNNRFLVWDVQTHEALVTKKTSKNVSSFVWTDIEANSRSRHNPTYMIAAAVGNVVESWELKYEISQMQYVFHGKPFQVGQNSGRRLFNCVSACDKTGLLACSTEVGDVFLFDYKQTLLKYILPPVASGGMYAVMNIDDKIICGNGDGNLSLMRRQRLESKVALDGGITCLGIDRKGMTPMVITGTNAGKIYSCPLDNICQQTLTHEAHTGPIVGISMGLDSDTFASLEKGGRVSVWSMSTYKRLASVRGPSNGCVIQMFGDGVFCGFAGGQVVRYRANDLKVVYNIDSAHRGRITSIGNTKLNDMLLTGGEDGALRIWNRNTKAFISQFSCHKGAVTSIVPDNRYHEFVHTCGADRQLTTVSLRKERIIKRHLIHNGIATSMVQRIDSEHELISTVSDGRLLVWDEDSNDPVFSWNADNVAACAALALSPDGKYLAVVGDTYLLLYTVADYKLLFWASVHSKNITSVQWTPDQQKILTAAEDSCVCVWSFSA